MGTTPGARKDGCRGGHGSDLSSRKFGIPRVGQANPAGWAAPVPSTEPCPLVPSPKLLPLMDTKLEGDCGFLECREGCATQQPDDKGRFRKSRPDWHSLCIHLHRTAALVEPTPLNSFFCGRWGGGSSSSLPLGEEEGALLEEDRDPAQGCGVGEAWAGLAGLKVYIPWETANGQGSSPSFSGGSFSLLNQELAVLMNWPLWFNLSLGHSWFLWQSVVQWS